MAELVGLTASVASLGKLVIVLGTLIAEAKAAPKEILELEEEVQNVTLVFDELKQVQRRQPWALTRLHKPVQRAGETVRQLAELVERYDGSNKDIVSRLRWLKDKVSRKGLLEQLRSQKENISLLLQLVQL